uniref:Transmembrane protein 18 n=1 Tax=Rhizophora mucronata TaxID=61149 RepID=A0A2P2IRF5_RHIMU
MTRVWNAIKEGILIESCVTTGGPLQARTISTRMDFFFQHSGLDLFLSLR